MRIALVLLLMVFEIALAQSQAPITWGTARLLMNAPQGLNVTYGVFPHGDTLILAGFYMYGAAEVAAVCVSGDNGQTFSPWHTFLTPDSADGYVTFAVTSAGLYCCTSTQGFWRGLYHSTDLGQTWTSPTVTYRYLEIKATRGDTIWCAAWSWSADTLRMTTDGGQQFSPPIGLDLHLGSVDHLAVSDTSLVVLSRTEFPGIPNLTTFMLTAPRTTDQFGTPVMLNPTYWDTFLADIEMDRNGTGMMVSAATNTPPGDGLIFLAQTYDQGQTWLPAQIVEPQASGYAPFVRHAEHEWLVAWFDSCVTPQFSYWGARYRFSANNGRSWYPIQQGFGENVSGGQLGPVDLQDNRVRYYAHMDMWNGVDGRYYFQWEGQIQKDSLAPEISTGEQLPPFLPADSVVTFAANGTDNDSLWQMSVILRHPGQVDSLVVLLPRQQGNDYQESWTVSADSGEFVYYYRAEDMWENVAAYPGTGVFSFHTTGWSRADAIGPYGPATYSVQVFPNPCNGWPSIQLSPEWFSHGKVTVEVYNLLGQCLIRREFGGQTGGGELISLSENRTLEAASGVYLLRVSSKARTRTAKFCIMK